MPAAFPLLCHSAPAGMAAAPIRPEPFQITSREAYLKAMRQVASSVAIVTTDGQAGRHGATVTAFCSVSADPPTLLVCLRTGSRICDAVKANGVFTLNIIPDDSDNIARVFSGEFDAIHSDRFEGVELVEHYGLAPAIDGAVSFACRTVRHELQDSHTIIVGKVGEIVSQEIQPLTYHKGTYCRIRRDASTGSTSERTTLASSRPFESLK